MDKTNPAAVEGFVRELENDIRRSRGRLVGHVEYLKPREAEYRDTSRPLHTQVKRALTERGIGRTYSHQAAAIDAAHAGKNVVISTSTASGKSACYNAPVLERLLERPEARALYLFPTKALGHDQESSLIELIRAGDMGLRCDAYDGDTPQAARREIRARSQVIITNPDMLQVSVLPQHRYWQAFLSNLAYVVIDEAHYYRGVLGSHVAMIVRRLRRLTRSLGASPQFILCSATIANAEEHATRLVGLPFEVIDFDGSPSGGRMFVLLDSDSADENDGVANGINMRAAHITGELMRKDVKTLTFAQSRAGAERITQYTQEMLSGTGGRRRRRYVRPRRDLAEKIQSYRAGYLPEYRRETESKLRSGELLGVVSTNALELGIDIGGIDATVIAGYPGTIASSWQQAGRSGRSGGRSLSLMLLRSNPVDQFYARSPDAFFSAAHESARISLSNEHIVGAHLECAAWEMPLSRDDFDTFGESVLVGTARKLVDEGRLVECADRKRRLPEGRGNPCFDVNIRSSSGSEQYGLLDSRTEKLLEETSRMYALRELYPGAIYTHRTQPYRVDEFDDEARVAYLSRIDLYKYTQPVMETDVELLDDGRLLLVGKLPLWHGPVRIRTKVQGYYERSLYSRYEENVPFHSVEMPALEYETMAVWFVGRESGGENDIGALHSIGHIGGGALAMLAMCDRRDLGGAVLLDHPQLNRPAAFIYELDVGGIGLVDFVLTNAVVFVDRMHEMVSSCDCDEGCPNCVESAFCSDDLAEPPSKEGLLRYLDTQR